MDIIVRKATKKDAEAILQVELNAKLDNYANFISNERLEQYKKSFKDDIEKYKTRPLNMNGSVNYVAEIDGKTVGVMDGSIYSFKPHYAELGYAEINTAYVAPQYQGKGIARKLFEQVCLDLKKLGATKMIIAVFKDNILARKVYEKFGGHLDSYTEYREKENQTTVFYLYDL